MLNPNNATQVSLYCSNLYGYLNLNMLFLDKSGFNLHISNNYGYSVANSDAVTAVIPSHGQNILLCAVFSTIGNFKEKYLMEHLI